MCVCVRVRVRVCVCVCVRVRVRVRVCVHVWDTLVSVGVQSLNTVKLKVEYPIRDS